MAGDRDDEKEKDEEISSNDDTPSHSEDEEIDEIDRYWPLPAEIKIDFTVSYASKSVSAFAFNHNGTRFAAGSHDYEVKIWDFSKPDTPSNCQPCGQSIIKNLNYSKDDEQILVISGSCQATLISKDGTSMAQCPKGDQYISDMNHTKGHVQMLNDGCWSPKDRPMFITSSNDGTIRVWDCNKLGQQMNVIKIRSPTSGLKAIPNVSRYSRDGLSIITGCNDGTIMMWDTRRKFVTTSASIKNAHLKGSEITGIDLSYGLTKLCSRSEDESCKLWDLRQLKNCLACRTGLNALYSNSDCAFSPNDELILLGTSGSGKNDPGQLLVLDAVNDLSTKTEIDNEEGAVIRCAWQPKINHIGYSCSKGNLSIAYDKRRSILGFSSLSQGSSIQFGYRRKRKIMEDEGDQISLNDIVTPNALYRDDRKDAQTASSSANNPAETLESRVKPVGSTLSSYVAQRIAKRRA